MSERFVTLGRMAAGAVHDLANYLTVVDLSLSMAEGESNSPQVTKSIADARQAMAHSLRIMSSLLTYARGSSPGVATIELPQMVDRLLELTRPIIPSDVRVSVESDPSTPSIEGVPSEIEQLVLNLVINACEAMPGGGELCIRTAANGAAVRLEVEDHGKGLSTPVGTSTKPGRGGVGLGMTIVRDVAERHRARIEWGIRPGGGTIARVSFPPAGSRQ